MQRVLEKGELKSVSKTLFQKVDRKKKNSRKEWRARGHTDDRWTATG